MGSSPTPGTTLRHRQQEKTSLEKENKRVSYFSIERWYMGRASVSKTEEKRSSRLRSATLWPRSLVVRILAFQAVGRSVQIRPGLPFSYIALIEYRLVRLTLNQ